MYWRILSRISQTPGLKPRTLFRNQARTVVVSSKFQHVDLPEDKSFPEFMLEKFEQWPSRLAMLNSTNSTSCRFGDIRQLVDGVASSLWHRGIRQNDVLCFLSPSSVEYYLTSLGVMRLGAVVTGVNPIFTNNEIVRQLKDSQASYLITTPDLLPKAEEVAQEYSALKEIYLTGKPTAGLESVNDFMKGKGTFPQVALNPKEDPAYFFYSSGTTGFPKAVKTTHYNLIASAALSGTIESQMYHPGPQVVTNFLPMFHNSGFICGTTKPLYMGCTVLAIQKYEAGLLLELIEKHKVRTVGTTPSMLSRLTSHPDLHKYDISSLDTFTLGGAPIGDKQMSLIRKIPNVKHIRCAYGCTEGSGLSHGTYYKDDTSDIPNGSVGILQPNMELKITDLETGKELDYNQIGEIWVRGPLVMKGYLNNKEADKECMTADGWLRTGDVGYCKESTELFIVDRIKDFIKCKGFQVAPAELEDWLMSHPAVAEACVVGLPDGRVGEAPTAFVVCKPGTKVSADELIQLTNNQVAAYKQLRGLHFVEDLPKSPTGKIQRRLVKEKAIQNASQKEKAIITQ